MDWRKMKEREGDSSKEGLSIVIKRKRGRIAGKSIEKDFDESDARTPFEALRYKLRLSRKDWGELIGCSVSTIGMMESGEYVGSVGLAKRMVEEARKYGVAVTLDELYQHVIPQGMEENIKENMKESVEVR
jgi:DNA-binding XRE family transcriptional regulator